MRFFHDSRELKYREPFGAVTTATEIKLSLKVEGDAPESVRAVIRKGDSVMPQFAEMKDSITADGSRIYTTIFKAPDEGCLLWYYFAIEVGDEDNREIIYYGNNEYDLGGKGQAYHADPHPYQITVYKESHTPDWYKDSIVYQIFPDRFARDEDWKERCEVSVREVNARPGGEKRLIQEDWNRKAYYIKDHDGRVTDWPIYGGSLKGIEEKLDYLKSLGVSSIYLNPVFESTSNHHYDTADYMKIDPSLGTEEDFVSLTTEAKKRGIRIFLDGVFSHTGADSKYFDRYGNYEKGIGAYANEDSPYRSWYKFDDNEACGYRSWWGVDDLPEVNEMDPGFCDLITGEDGVIAHWMKLGASGWRLDVADELPDSFIEAVTKRVKTTDPEGLVIGEVWEDASNKISYGERRRYFMGDELDGTMNYPLRSALLDYVNYTISAEHAGEIMLSMKENYPKENFYGALNLIGSHDRERIITAMACEEDYPSAVKKVRLLSVLQYSLPGVPCIYYGDEVGLTGGPDPENRNGYPWKHENLDLGYHYRMLGLIYNEHPLLRDGEFTMLSGRYDISEDVFAFVRSGGKDNPDHEKILVLANRSYGPVDVDLTDIAEIRGGYALELLGSKVIEMGENGFSEVLRMPPLSSKMICILDAPPAKEKLPRVAGVICNISSLGEGKLGAPARAFADYLASAGMKIWQVLPLNPTGLGDSPYCSRAAFAGNPDYINREELPDSSGYEKFCRENIGWLKEYVAYTVVREIQNNRSWSEWPEKYKFGDADEILEDLKSDYVDRIEELVRDQYYFDVQWKDLKQYANHLGILMMGDLPIYMAGDSADVWAHQEIFRLDENGRLKVHAGVPPDAFSKEGQDWGNPLYDWEYLKTTGYDWWMKRLHQCADRYDILRLDHFRGFSEYYAVPEGFKPTKGYWQHGPGMDFFRAIRDMLNDARHEDGSRMLILAEDLGFLDDAVLNLLKLAGLPGMNIWQFSADEMMAMDHDQASDRAFYTGTHDNDTLMGFVTNELNDDPSEAKAEALSIIRKIYESPAPLAIVQLQDMFLLGSEARMNIPGIAEDNWKWKMPEASVQESFEDAEERADWFRKLAESTNR